MIPSFVPHQQFVRNALGQARANGCLRSGHRHFDVWRKLRKTNLDYAYSLLSVLYSDDQGRLDRKPISMFRSCLAMTECGVTGFDVWVHLMRDDPFYAIISGFDLQDVPGVGTFYDFQVGWVEE